MPQIGFSLDRRGDPPQGNTVNRTPIDSKPESALNCLPHLMEGIGIALDVTGNTMFADLGGSIYSFDGTDKRMQFAGQHVALPSSIQINGEFNMTMNQPVGNYHYRLPA